MKFFYQNHHHRRRRHHNPKPKPEIYFGGEGYPFPFFFPSYFPFLLFPFAAKRPFKSGYRGSSGGAVLAPQRSPGQTTFDVSIALQ